MRRPETTDSAPKLPAGGLSRRAVLGAGIGLTFFAARPVRADEDTRAFVEEIAGRAVTPSDRVRLTMPASFPTGYTVPMDIDVETPMSADDFLREVRVFAPLNPIVEVVRFRFLTRRMKPQVSTRIRLAAPQDVVALAEMGDGSLLMAATRVVVESNGCT